MPDESRPYLLEELSRIAAHPPLDEQRWLEYVPLAARLAALGDSAPLRRWPELSSSFAERVESLLIERAREGIWDLSQTLGRDLGLAVIDAQDFACFLRREDKILPVGARRMLAAWREAAEEVELDEDAVSTLRRFLKRFPLPARDRLGPVDVPRSFIQTIALASLARPRPTLELSWPASPSESVPLAEIGQLDAGRPSDRLKRAYERLDVPIDVPKLGQLTVSRRINDAWQVVLDIQGDADRPLKVDVVRLGSIPGHAATDVHGRWLFDLSAWEHLERVHWLDEPLVVGFTTGHRLKLR